MNAALRMLLVGSCLVSPLYSRDLLPEHWIENIPAEDDSVQQCLVFRTVPGVIYQVETSNDLINWTPGEEIQGLDHELVVTMREFTPAPPPEEGGNPPPLPPVVTTQANLRLQPASGTAGGTVVSWRSLDDGVSPLKGTDRSLRLMHSGEKTRGGRIGNLLVKEKWDAAEAWLRTEEANKRL